MHVTSFWKTGEIYYGDHVPGGDPPVIPVPGVTVDLTGDSSPAPAVTLTDEYGHYEFYSLQHYGTYRVTPYKDPDRDVWHQIVTSYDASMILWWICGGLPFSHKDSIAADVTCDGTVSAYDASTILKWMVCNYCEAPFNVNNCIGEWYFEGYDCNIPFSYTGLGYWDVIHPTEDHLDNCFDAIIRGDVSQNWTPAVDDPKVVADGIDAEVLARTVTLNFGEARAVNVVITSNTDLKVADVSVDGMVEWADSGGEVRIAAASAGELGPVTVTFEKMVRTTLEISALVDEGVVLTGAVKMAPVPTEFALSQNYPNPFNPTTTIEYALPQDAKVKVEVYNTLGQVVAELVDTEQEAGYHRVTWDAGKAASGVYFYRLVADNFTATKRMILMK
jgi:hypothetical protein